MILLVHLLHPKPQGRKKKKKERKKKKEKKEKELKKKRINEPADFGRCCLKDFGSVREFCATN